MTDLSIIIIGYNTQNSLLRLLSSINLQQFNQKYNIECIYVDDGSTDSSVEYFEKYNLLFEKKCIKLKKNKGRVCATQRGINAATGKWLFFVRSNVFLKKNLFKEYFKSMHSVSGDAFMGRLLYTSKDKAFHRYLNNVNRGTNKYEHNSEIHYRLLLFGNSVFKSSLFKKQSLNQNLRFYGGEEIDLAEKLFFLKNKKIYFCKQAVAVRNNHPSFYVHLERLKEFGEKNLPYLSKNNQKIILHFCFYLKKIKVLLPVWSCFLLFSKKTYKLNYLNSNYFLIRLGLISAIMVGICKSKQLQNYQNLNHLK